MKITRSGNKPINIKLTMENHMDDTPDTPFRWWHAVIAVLVFSLCAFGYYACG